MAKGTIKRVFSDRGFGFIKPEAGGEDVYFRASRVTGEVAFNHLREDDEVEYEARRTDAGMQATRVRATEAEAMQPRSDPARKASYRFLNPYNFVRFLAPPGKQASRGAGPSVTAIGAALGAAGITNAGHTPLEATTEARLLGRCAPPPHDRYVGLTGEITCTVETATPLFVSDSENAKAHGEHRSYEFFKLDGQHALPASSLRGALRSLFEAVTNSCLLAFDDEARLSYHLDTRRARALVPALVEKDGDEWKLRLLTGTTRLSYDQLPSGPQYAAWVPRYFGQLIRRSQNAPGPTSYGGRNNISLNGLKHKDPCWAVLKKYRHPQRGFEFWGVEQLAKERADLRQPQGDEIVAEGYLCLTNQNIENKHDERFFFRQSGVDGAPRVPLKKSVREDYEILIRDYQQRHGDRVKRRAKPEEREGKKPAYSRFIVHEEEARLRPDDLVYTFLKGDGAASCEVEFIVPVSVPRVTYEDAIGTLLPDDGAATGENPLAACKDIALLCPACRVFGWVRPKSDTAAARVAYAGRVRFSHARLTHSAGVLPPTPLAILSSPKPTTTRFYLRPRTGEISERWTDEAGAGKGYDCGENKLRGRKFYRHHAVAREEEYRRAGAVCDDQNRTVRDALAPGARFGFTIYFENLAACELGALLWMLEMDGRGFHRLGFAKPLGFGSVKITIDGVKTLDPARRYASLDDGGWQPAAREWLAACVEKFKDGLTQRYAKKFEELDNVRDLRALLNEPSFPLPIHYPRTAEEPSSEGRNYEWFVGNNKRNRNLNYALAPAADDKGLPLITGEGVEVS